MREQLQLRFGRTVPSARRPRLRCGIDEAGRGPIAGPVTAAAVILPRGFPVDVLDDSKALAPEERRAAAELIRARAVAWAVGWATHQEIDRVNILQATLLAMRRAVLVLQPAATDALIDGNRCPVLPIPARAIVRGDALEPCISAASILAKTERDKVLRALADIYPAYGFERHAGYPTAEHLAALEAFGPCAVHRKSFGPVKRILQKTFFE